MNAHYPYYIGSLVNQRGFAVVYLVALYLIYISYKVIQAFKRASLILLSLFYEHVYIGSTLIPVGQ